MRRTSEAYPASSNSGNSPEVNWPLNRAGGAIIILLSSCCTIDVDEEDEVVKIGCGGEGSFEVVLVVAGAAAAIEPVPNVV